MLKGHSLNDLLETELARLSDDERVVVERFLDTLNARLVESPPSEPPSSNPGVTPIDGLPRMSEGAPAPLVFGDEVRLAIGYFCEITEPPDDHENVVPMIARGGPATYAVFLLEGVSSVHWHSHGPDEHPIQLSPAHYCDVWEVRDPSLLQRSFLGANAPQNDEERHHLIFGFRDTGIECVCQAFEFKLYYGDGDPEGDMMDFVYRTND